MSECVRCGADAWGRLEGKPMCAGCLRGWVWGPKKERRRVRMRFEKVTLQWQVAKNEAEIEERAAHNLEYVRHMSCRHNLPEDERRPFEVPKRMEIIRKRGGFRLGEYAAQLVDAMEVSERIRSKTEKLKS